MVSALRNLWARAASGSESQFARAAEQMQRNSSTTHGGGHPSGMSEAELKAFRHWMSEVNADMMRWLALVNLGLVFLLAMKNNPIAFISGYSHERLNVLHRWAGRFVWVQASIHVCCYMYTWSKSGSFVKRLTQEDFSYRAGFTAWLFFTILFLCSFEFIRRRAYEYFFMVHIACAIGAVVALGFHEPKTYGIILYLIGSMWVFDRLVRFVRGVHYSKGTRATIYPMPGEAVKVVLNTTATFQPASHGFLTMPSLKLLQSHPFTISSADSLEFIVRGQRGFTRRLYDRAINNPGESLPCYFDGPYGNVPDYRRMNRVILFAGGSGGSFSFSIATDIARNLDRCCVDSIEFVWVIRERSHTQWFEKELEELRDCPIVNLRIFVTREASNLIASHSDSSASESSESLRNATPVSATDVDETTDSDTPVDEKKKSQESSSPTETLTINFLALPEKALSLAIETEDKSNSTQRRRSSLGDQYFQFGRPDMSSIVKEAVRNADQNDLIAVGACGPTELMRCARNAAAGVITIGGPSISLHCEQFGWG
ncbi:Ferric/cupric reductase transmembrane component [Drechslerella dactyloides]|uniref:Ferric/cupric reductase transmembrane component n=1 Tax=Drechslerella dactyloides TaxID=74499 RepID=A0AAD6J3Q3_DREDA|nr:Ferric/cupric reductase transmembrane component [Drechslerella dactyloides]